MIRIGTIEDLAGILSVIHDAKELFLSQGQSQWQDKDGYPNEETFLNDLSKNIIFVSVDKDIVTGILVLSKQEEIVYENLVSGTWLNEEKYYVIHRVAVKKEYYHQGIAVALFQEAENYALYDHIYNIRVDTHEENKRMEHLLSKLGYQKCGIIYLQRKDVIDPKRNVFHKILYK